MWYYKVDLRRVSLEPLASTRCQQIKWWSVISIDDEGLAVVSFAKKLSRLHGKGYSVKHTFCKRSELLGE